MKKRLTTSGTASSVQQFMKVCPLEYYLICFIATIAQWHIIVVVVSSFDILGKVSRTFRPTTELGKTRLAS